MTAALILVASAVAALCLLGTGVAFVFSTDRETRKLGLRVTAGFVALVVVAVLSTALVVINDPLWA